MKSVILYTLKYLANLIGYDPEKLTAAVQHIKCRPIRAAFYDLLLLCSIFTALNSGHITRGQCESQGRNRLLNITRANVAG